MRNSLADHALYSNRNSHFYNPETRGLRAPQTVARILETRGLRARRKCRGAYGGQGRPPSPSKLLGRRPSPNKLQARPPPQIRNWLPVCHGDAVKRTAKRDQRISNNGDDGNVRKRSPKSTQSFRFFVRNRSSQIIWKFWIPIHRYKHGSVDTKRICKRCPDSSACDRIGLRHWNSNYGVSGVAQFSRVAV